jgi:hypothetical protein
MPVHGAAALWKCRVLSYADSHSLIARASSSCIGPAGNYVVQDIATAQYGMAQHLPTWAAKDIERLKLTADAKMRTVYRLFPAVVRQMHAWRLLTPVYNAVGALGIQVSICVQQSP